MLMMYRIDASMLEMLLQGSVAMTASVETRTPRIILWHTKQFQMSTHCHPPD